MALPNDRDPEMGNAGYLLRHQNSPNNSRISSGSDCGGENNILANKSASTDQSSLDQEQPNKPLIVEKYMINKNDQRTNYGVNVDKSKEFMNNNKSQGKNNSISLSNQRLVLRARICLVLGCAMFVIGSVLFVFAVVFMKDKGQTHSGTEAVVGELKDESDRISKGSVHNSIPTTLVLQSSTVTTITPTTTTTVSYDHLVNLASDKEAFQSSTFRTSHGLLYSAYAAVDGSRENSVNIGACAQTNNEDSPVWWVDLGSNKLVKRVIITQPSDCCFGSLSDFEVRVGQQLQLDSNILCQHHPGTAITKIVHIECHNLLYGRYVSIQLLKRQDHKTRQLTLCEVDIYAQ